MQQSLHIHIYIFDQIQPDIMKYFMCVINCASFFFQKKKIVIRLDITCVLNCASFNHDIENKIIKFRV